MLLSPRCLRSVPIARVPRPRLARVDQNLIGLVSPTSTTTRTRTRAMSSRGNQFTSFAEDNFSQSGASGLYDRARPTYPGPAFDRILSVLGGHATVVELGAGSGIFTRGFLQAAASATQDADDLIDELIAVEPSRGMRDGFEKKLDELDRNRSASRRVRVSIQDGLFDRIPVDDAKADLVVIAQAFHWVGRDGESAIREIARVLKPHGTLALIWNYEDRSVPWVAQLRDAYEVHEAGTPQARLGWWKSIFDTEFYSATYAPAELETFHRDLATTEDGVVDRILSKSYITALAQDEQDRVARDMRAIVARGDGKRWIDQTAGTFQYPYNTELYLIRKK